MGLRNLIISLLLIIFCNLNLQSADKKNILILNSYHKGLQWTDRIVDGFKDGLDESEIEKEFFIEYLDLKRFFDADYYNKLHEFYKTKYANHKIDLILLSDDYALNFMLQYRDSIFPDVPVVFSGVNNPHKYPKGYSGIIENNDYLANLNLIKKLHPEYSKIYIIMDESKTGNIIYDRIYQYTITSNNSYSFEFLRSYSFTELYKKLATLDENSVVLLTAFTKDRLNNYTSYDEIGANISNSTSVPVYGLWDFYLGKGLVGGKMNVAYNQGYQAAQMANQILNGKNVNEIEIANSIPEYCFDSRRLKKFGISKSKLPKNSRVINTPFSFANLHKTEVIFFGIIFVLLIIVIFVLWGYIVYRKKKTKVEKRYLQKIQLSNERLQIAKENAEESDRLKSAFLANISHELRTPMNGIIGFTKLIINSNDLDKETYTKYLNIVNKSGHLLLDLVNDIIDLSKIEAKQLKVNYSKFRLDELIDELLSFFISEREHQGKENINIIAEKEYDYKDLSIYSDSNRIRQVLYNLLNNALKFTREGLIKFGYYVDSPNVVFFVKDTGIGLSKEEQDVIFERFRQADERTTRMYGGAGIGLSISRGIVESLKGRIWVESEKEDFEAGKKGGSTFYFAVPFNPVKNNQNTEGKVIKNKQEVYAWPNKTILIVEDSIVSYELLTKFLKDAKVSFVHASDGEQAVKICKSNKHIDLVLMDIQLPIMDGLEATNLIKKENPDLPIIAQTANALNEDKDKIIAAGCDDYLSKPINRKELQQKVNKFLGSS